MSIDARVVIGVTGHRKLDNPESLRPRVRRCLEEIRRALPPLRHSQYQFCVLSPLADGADRLVASELLKQGDVYLEVVLPLPRERYETTFLSSASVAEFDALLAKARVVRQPYASHDPEAAYAWVGRHVVEQCDVLIAIWNGDESAGRGGTGEIVRHARECGCPIFWINPDHDSFLQPEWGNGLGEERFNVLDGYNHLVAQYPSDQTPGAAFDDIKPAAARLDPAALKSAAAVSPDYEAADNLARLFQRRHFRAGTYVYSLAAVAVVAVATQTLFLHHNPIGGLAEVLCMTTILALIYFGKRGHWHAHWMECRYLAERLRAMMFLSACGLEISQEVRAAGVFRQQWMSSAVAAVRARLPLASRPADAAFPAIQEFLAVSWLEDQATYHRSKAARCEHRHHQLERAGVMLFFVCFVASAANLLTLVPLIHNSLHHAIGEILPVLQNVFTWISLAAPASGGAVAAINHHREFKKLAHRSDEMAIRLTDMSRRLRDVPTLAEAGPVLTEIEEVVAGENVEWLTNVRFHSLDSPA